MAASSAAIERTWASAGRADGDHAVPGAEPAHDDVGQRPVHRVGHQLGQDATGRADQRAGDDQGPVAR